jgi:hypothetical protein
VKDAVVIRACSDCTLHSHATLYAYLLVLLAAVLLASAVVWRSLGRGRVLRWFGPVASVVFVGSLLWLGAMLWQAVTVEVGHIHVACGTALGATEDTYTNENSAQAACKQVAQQRVSDARRQGIPAVAIGGALTLLAGVVAFRPSRASKTQHPALR